MTQAGCLKRHIRTIFAAMQAPVYILAGMIAGRSFRWRYYRTLPAFLTIITALFFNGLIDKLSVAAYGPSGLHFMDPFWLFWHVAGILSTVVLLYMFAREYWLGIMAALLPFLDYPALWLSALPHSAQIYMRPWMHDGIQYFFDNVVPLNYLNLLPDHRSEPLACLVELLLSGLLIFIFRMQVLSERK